VRAVWQDKSEEAEQVNLTENKKLRKLRLKDSEETVDTEQYEQRLRNQ